MASTDQTTERCPCGEDTPEGCAKRPTRHCGDNASDDDGAHQTTEARAKAACRALCGECGYLVQGTITPQALESVCQRWRLFLPAGSFAKDIGRGDEQLRREALAHGR
jgi:hypothetical protein